MSHDVYSLKDYVLKSRIFAQNTFLHGDFIDQKEVLKSRFYSGTSGSDIYEGISDVPNFINGLGGSDFLTGGSFDDVLLGEGGGDVLNGGAGNDYLRGDGGKTL